MKRVRVLVVDDHRDSVDILAALLKIRSARLIVDTAYDGPSGLALALTSEFDAVIVDLMLPGLSGREVCREIRLKLQDATPVLIALSGYVVGLAQPPDMAGFDHVLRKPANIERLMEILLR